MNVKVLEQGQVGRILEIEVPKERVKKAMDDALNQYARSAKIPGFRQGKAPRAVIEKSFGAGARHEAIEHLVPQAILEALEKSKLEAIGRPRIEDLKMAEDETLSFKARVEVKPQLTLLAGVGGLKLKAEKLALGSEQVEAELKRLAEEHAILGPSVERPAQKGDWVLVDYVAKDSGKALEGGRAERVPVELGTNRSLPGFEEGLTGVAKGGKATIQVPFPEDHPDARLKGKSIEFVVHVHDVREKQLAPVDDDLAKQAGPYQTLDELKAKLAETLKAQAESRRKAKLAEQAGEALVAQYGFEMPTVLIDAETDYLVDRERQELERRGMAFRDDVENLGALRKELKPQAEKRARLSLILEALAQREGLKVSDEEYKKEMARFAQVMRAGEAEIIKWAAESGREEGIKARLLNDKSMDWVLSQAPVEEA